MPAGQEQQHGNQNSDEDREFPAVKQSLVMSSERVTERIDPLISDDNTRQRLWGHLTRAVDEYTERIHTHAIRPPLDPEQVRSVLENLNFSVPMDPFEAVDFLVVNLWQHQNHTAHPGYFGLFDPAPVPMAVAADLLVSAFNPQLAAWNQSPFAVEVEQYLVRAFGLRFGYTFSDIDGTFTSGGAEANHTAILTALVNRLPSFRSLGLSGLSKWPVIYLSSEGHHSIIKAARLCGLGDDAVRIIQADNQLLMPLEELVSQIEKDRAAGARPLLVVGTAGTTNSGTIDRLSELADIADQQEMWFHVDAAWGGAVALAPEFQVLLRGIERADSITFDPHKWLSMTRGAGMYLTRHPKILDTVFHVSPPYMPLRRASSVDVVDPFRHSMQWTRRFVGLPLFLSLLVMGWDRLADDVRRRIALADYLRDRLFESGWNVISNSLAVICFDDPAHQDLNSNEFLQSVAEYVVNSGEAWVSTTRIGRSRPVLRACISNYRSGEDDVDKLITLLSQGRNAAMIKASL